MHRTATRWFGMISCMAIVLLTAAGCFQQAGSGLDASAFSAELPTFTPIPPPTEIPTDIPPPTEIPTDIPPPTDIPTEVVFVPPTETPLVAFSAPTETPIQDTGIIVADAPQIALQATEVPLLQAEQPLVVEQQPVQQVDDLALTATSIVQNATATEAFNQTATMQAIMGPPTLEPTIPLVFTETPQIIPGQPTQQVIVPMGADCVHEVRAEDRNLYRLSLHYGVPVVDIARASGIVDIDLILIGQRLIIPGCGTTGAVPPPTSMPTAGAQTGDVVAQPVPGAQSAGGVTHIVEQGQTLFEISLQYGVPVNTIAAANGISNIDLIYLNQQLIIP